MKLSLSGVHRPRVSARAIVHGNLGMRAAITTKKFRARACALPFCLSSPRGSVFGAKH